MSEARTLAGLAAVVTGSSTGIGRAVAIGLAREGARVVVNGRAGPDGRSVGAEQVAGEIRASGGEALALAGSVADFDFAGELVAACVDRFGAIDILVNCAGVPEPVRSSILDIDPVAWRELVDVHLSGTFYGCRHAAPRMADRGSGSIINTASHGALGVYGGTGYPAAKGATLSLTWAMAAELRGAGVRVNAVCPGARTRLSSGPDYERRIQGLHERGLLDEALRDTSLRPPDAGHLGAMYAFLAGPQSAAVTGQVFSASGGYVGLFSPLRERLLAYRDVDSDGAWPVEELARALAAADGWVGSSAEGRSP